MQLNVKTVLFQIIQLSISIDFVCTQLNVKTSISNNSVEYKYRFCLHTVKYQKFFLKKIIQLSVRIVFVCAQLNVKTALLFNSIFFKKNSQILVEPRELPNIKNTKYFFMDLTFIVKITFYICSCLCD